MPARSRIFSELLAEETENGSTLFSSRDTAPALKRQKTGLNSKFDQMVERMNATYCSPMQSNGSRKRARSVGSSSVSSYGAPQTPLNSYDGLQAGALGRGFQVIKMRSDVECDGDSSSQLSSSRNQVSLPAWLSETFCTLVKEHPLRLLLPRSSQEDGAPSMQDIVETHSPKDEHDHIFAFSPPHSPSSNLESHIRTLESPINMNSYNVLDLTDDDDILPENASGMLRDEFSSPIYVPFSTPGPASSIFGPAPPKSHVPMLSTAVFSQNDSSDTNHFCASFDNTQANPEFAPLTTLSIHPRSRFPNSTNDLNVFANAELVPETKTTASAPLDHHQFDFPSEYVPTVPDCQTFPSAHSAPIHDARGYSAAFSTPGPGFLASRLIPLAEDQSEPPESPHALDYTDIDFRWTPFNRTFTPSTGCKTSRSLEEPTNDLDQDEIGTLPQSSDDVSVEQEIYGPVTARERSTSNDQLPMASSSDGAGYMLEHESQTPGADRLGSKQTGLQSLPPLRFRTTPSSEPPLPPDQLSCPHSVTTACRTIRSTPTEQAPRSPQDSRVAFAPAPGIYVSPLRKSASPAMTSDFNHLKSGLLDALDRIARPSEKRHSETGEKVDETEGPSCSQDTIESWGEEDEAITDHE